MPERHLGQTLGKFRVDSLIGSGGFAWVYKAWDPDLEIPVALKVLKPQYAGDEKFETRFRREASTAARLRHPNIVKIFAVGKENGAVYFAMDYLPQNLSDRLDVMSTLPEPMLLRMGIDVASALGFAHREGVIHRDIKVDNILFDDHGNAVVADFGIARAVSNYVEQTATNMVVGTPQYFSPEQARGQVLDGRADIYSLGVTLFRAATGTLPFNGEDWYEIARQHVEDRAPRPRSINPELSRELEKVILTCLEKEPEDRYPTAEELCHALAAIAGEGGSSGYRTLVVPPLEANAGTVALPVHQRRSTAARVMRRHRGSIGTVAAVAVGLLIGVPLFNARRAGQAATPPSTVDGGVVASAGGTPTGTAPGQPTVTTEGQLVANSTPVRRNPTFFVTVPEGAQLSVNGTAQAAPAGTWQSSEVGPGTYTFVAKVRAPGECLSARVTKQVTILAADTGQQRIVLNPRGCGWLRFDTRPRQVFYTATPVGGAEPGKIGSVLSGDLASLPAGEYAISLTSSGCADWSGPRVQVRPGAETLVWARLICGSGKE